MPKSLASAWEDLLARMPQQWRDLASEIFVFAPPFEAGVSPEAIARGAGSRTIEVPRGFMWLMVGFGEAHQAVQQPLLEWLHQRNAEAPFTGDSLDDLWRWVLEGAQEFVMSHAASSEAEEWIAWIEHVARDPRAAWEEKQVDGHIETSRPADVLVDFGLRFAVAHEVGHHLLNHLRPQTQVVELGVREQVDSWAAETHVNDPTGLNRAEMQEWTADVFALMLLARQQDTDPPEDEFFRLSCIGGGASLALLALFVGGESVDEVDAMRGTHPRVEERLAGVLYGLTQLGRRVVGPTFPGTDEDMGADASFHALIVFGSAVVILEFLLRSARDAR